jgi:hypothetical protein
MENAILKFDLENAILNFDTHQRRSRFRRCGPPVQLSFNLCTSSTAKTVHLLGSWDNYSGQLPLARDKSSSTAGAWKGTYKFHGTTLEAGQRYWYYYIIDGYHVSRDPKQPSTTESTTGCVLNILDLPSTSSKSSTFSSKSLSFSRREARASNSDIPKGRPLSISQIQSPKPISPHTTKVMLETEYGTLEAATVTEIAIDDEDDSDYAWIEGQL